MEGEAAERAREEARLLPQGDAAWAAEPEPVTVIELVDREKPAPLWAWILLVFSVRRSWECRGQEEYFSAGPSRCRRGTDDGLHGRPGDGMESRGTLSGGL